MPPAISCPNYTWPSIIRVNFSELGYINYNFTRNRYYNYLFFYYLKYYITILEIPNAF
jgi:hypothetical protein